MPLLLRSEMLPVHVVDADDGHQVGATRVDAQDQGIFEARVGIRIVVVERWQLSCIRSSLALLCFLGLEACLFRKGGPHCDPDRSLVGDAQGDGSLLFMPTTDIINV